MSHGQARGGIFDGPGIPGGYVSGGGQSVPQDCPHTSKLVPMSGTRQPVGFAPSPYASPHTVPAPCPPAPPHGCPPTPMQPRPLVPAVVPSDQPRPISGKAPPPPRKPGGGGRPLVPGSSYPGLKPLIPMVPPPSIATTAVNVSDVPRAPVVGRPAPAPSDPYAKYKLARKFVPTQSLTQTLKGMLGFGQPPAGAANSGIFDTPSCGAGQVPYASSPYAHPQTVPAPCPPPMAPPPCPGGSPRSGVLVVPPPSAPCPSTPVSPPCPQGPNVVLPPRSGGCSGFGSPDGLMGIF